MSDLYQSPVTTPSQGEQPAPQAPETGEPKYVTLEEAQKMADDAAERAFRKAQSYVDKGIKGKVEKMDVVIAEMRKQNVPISEAEEAAMRDALSSTWEQPDVATKQPQQPPLDPVSAIAWKKMKRAGIFIEQDDPELAMLDQTDEDLFLDSVAPAIEAKRQRLAISGKPPEVRVPGMTQGTPAHGATMDDVAAQLRALQVNPSKNMPEIMQLQQKLKSMISTGR